MKLEIGERRPENFAEHWPGQYEVFSHFEYASGSIETLVRMVETQGGITILPELALETLNSSQSQRLRFFEPSEPVREIGLVTHRHYVKKNLLDALIKEIDLVIPEQMKEVKGRKPIAILQEGKGQKK